jgi:hypothetical protein
MHSQESGQLHNPAVLPIILFMRWKADLDGCGREENSLSAGTRTQIFPVVLAVAS